MLYNNQYIKIIRQCYIKDNLCFIPLNNGQEAFTNKEYFDKVSKHNWCIDDDGYVLTNIKGKNIPLQRFLFPEIKVIRLINRNGLDCRKENIKTMKRECYIENNICYIPLNNGMLAFCDADRFNEVNQYNWTYTDRRATAYINHKNIKMHRFLYPEWKFIDHINHNILDNTSINLREVNHQQNMINRSINYNSKSGYKGVCFLGREKKWLASISVNKKRYRLGLFISAKEAAIAYNEKAKQLHGEYACLNIIKE